MEGIMAELFKDNLSVKEIIRLERSIAEQSAQFNTHFDNTIFHKKLILSCSDMVGQENVVDENQWPVLLYTSPSPRD